MSKIIAITNQKGGVGKTTTSINLSAILAYKKRKVLLIDLDPQGNTTSGLGIDKGDSHKTIYQSLILGTPLVDTLVKTKFANLKFIASDMNLSGAEIEMTTIKNREYLLKNLIDQVAGDYEYIFIDCPPSLGLLTMNALTAATSVIIPLQCEFYALEGMTQLLKTIGLIKSHYNPNLAIEGILPTMYDSRNNISKQVLAELRDHFPQYLFKSVIPRNVKLSEAPSFGLPIYLYDKNSQGALFYSSLADEINNQARLNIS
ncbi:MAG: ParA family protein [SAR324 cluster bacterium]|nr:ParA family protein [SAR324 cluster bacterium]